VQAGSLAQHFNLSKPQSEASKTSGTWRKETGSSLTQAVKIKKEKISKINNKDWRNIKN
jgi:hypothetical protein